MEVIYRGAEAVLTKGEYMGIPSIKKDRKPKEYRIKELDDEIRRKRTRKEARLLKKSRKSIETPHVLDLSESSLTMEEVEGRTLKEAIESGEEDPERIGREVGERVKKLHDQNIVHNDLTTSNMIKKGKEIYFIDFGLGEKTKRTEDKAMDLLVFKKMLKSTHWEEINDIWNGLKKGYGSKKILDRLSQIEKRVRYSK